MQSPGAEIPEEVEVRSEFSVSGDFLFGVKDSTISVNGGHGFSHFDGSGAGGSGGSIHQSYLH